MTIMSALSTLALVAGAASVAFALSWGVAMGWHAGRVLAAKCWGPLNTSSTSRVDNYFHDEPR